MKSIFKISNLQRKINKKNKKLEKIIYWTDSQIAINGSIYNVTTDEFGRASLQVNLMAANVYTYALFLGGDDTYKASHIASSKLTVFKKSTSLVASNKQFSAGAKKTIKVTLKTTQKSV